MRVLDLAEDRAVKNVVLYLKKNEAKELYDSLGSLLSSNKPGDHQHVDDEDYSHEITVVLYGDGGEDLLNERSRLLIAEDR